MKTKTKERSRQIGGRRTGRKITEDTPLTPLEQSFITEYIKTGNLALAMKNAGGIERNSDIAYKMAGRNLLRHPNVQKELNRIMEELKKESVATAEEVMQYFTSVMRGEVKDQFGLDAPLTERTRAAQEIARRTIDVDTKLRLQKEGVDNTPIQVTLNWAKD